MYCFVFFVIFICHSLARNSVLFLFMFSPFPYLWVSFMRFFACFFFFLPCQCFPVPHFLLLGFRLYFLVNSFLRFVLLFICCSSFSQSCPSFIRFVILFIIPAYHFLSFHFLSFNNDHLLFINLSQLSLSFLWAYNLWRFFSFVGLSSIIVILPCSSSLVSICTFLY